MTPVSSSAAPPALGAPHATTSIEQHIVSLMSVCVSFLKCWCEEARHLFNLTTTWLDKTTWFMNYVSTYNCSRGALKALADLSRRRAANAESFAYLYIIYIYIFIIYIYIYGINMYLSRQCWTNLDDITWSHGCPELFGQVWPTGFGTFVQLKFPQAHTWVTPSCHELGFTGLVPLLNGTADILA